MKCKREACTNEVSAHQEQVHQHQRKERQGQNGPYCCRECYFIERKVSGHHPWFRGGLGRDLATQRRGPRS